MYLVDTNIVSELRRGAWEARRWVASVDSSTIYLGVLTLGEIMRGIVIRARTDPKAASALAAWLAALRNDHANRILAITDEIAIEWGRLSVKRSRGEADALIAATAIVHDLISVTRNVVDFNDVGVVVVNPWDLP
jgi:predicted nucleic acid-binding protein